VEKTGTVLTRSESGKKDAFPSRFVIGADGAFSSVRESLMHLTRVDFQQQHIEACYKELTIPPTASGDFALNPHNGLHIWPRHRFMLIALPNPDKTFTATLFAPLEGDAGLKRLANAPAVVDYFKAHFEDVIKVVPQLESDFFQSPTSPLVTIRCKPWYFEDKCVLMGDAAHAVVPFYGQGMNSGFEDALIFDELWQKYNGDHGRVIREYGDLRQPQTDALADLSIANFSEMASHTTSARFLLKKKFESLLHTVTPSLWTPLYTMVAFTRTPFNEALEQAERQDTALKTILGMLGITAVGTALYYALRPRL